MSIIIWTAVSVFGALAFAALDWHHGETGSAAWMIVAAAASYAVAYRFYSKYIANKVFGLDHHRAVEKRYEGKLVNRCC